ncbi:hypothetical protein AMS59_22725 [Lysinibacillus sp. FJAT-14745]|uniref:hypothetical protein n=1 Tax=Lysinibacillus sp. FJAT-14745 TaxID=1704289 RepID=UPI0006AB7CFE|nr:hypothetical protein [Lysinibacillus sp. FJAT-14745]KOP69734.1 hypothetical protein AMS59_22725 [Lysinibacillus sp. FJAT-14745]
MKFFRYNKSGSPIKNLEVNDVRRSLIFQIDGREREQRLRTKLLMNTPQPKEESELPHISTKLTQEQIHNMMQVIEEIRLKGYKEKL